MTVGSVQGLLSTPAATTHAGGADAGSEGTAAQTQQSRRADPKHPVRQATGSDPHAKAGSQLEQLQALASQARLELRLDKVPKSDVVVIRFINPETGQVVRE